MSSLQQKTLWICSNAAKYEAVLKEEVEKYLADAQDLDTTIKNAVERGNKAIQE